MTVVMRAGMDSRRCTYPARRCRRHLQYICRIKTLVHISPRNSDSIDTVPSHSQSRPSIQVSPWTHSWPLQVCHLSVQFTTPRSGRSGRKRERRDLALRSAVWIPRARASDVLCGFTKVQQDARAERAVDDAQWPGFSTPPCDKSEVETSSSGRNEEGRTSAWPRSALPSCR